MSTSLFGQIIDCQSRYHDQVSYYAADYSNRVYTCIFTRVHGALSYFTTENHGHVMQHFVSKKLATLASWITYLAIQILHTFPCLCVVTLGTGSILLFNASSIALDAVFAGSLLLVQVIQNIMIAQTARMGVEVIQKQGSDIAQLLEKKTEEGIETLQIEAAAFHEQFDQFQEQFFDKIDVVREHGKKGWDQAKSAFTATYSWFKERRPFVFGGAALATGASYFISPLLIAASGLGVVASTFFNEASNTPCSESKARIALSGRLSKYREGADPH